MSEEFIPLRHEDCHPDGFLTSDMIDTELNDSVNTTVTSALPNYQLMRECVGEVVANKDDYIEKIYAIYHGATTDDDFIEGLAGAFDRYFPQTSQVLDIAATHPEIFMTRNDLASSTVLPYENKSKVTSSVYPKNDFNVPALSETGVHFDPSVIVSPTVSMTPVNGVLIPVKKYNHLIHSVQQRNWACRPINPKFVENMYHHHPLKYALRRFAVTCLNQIHYDKRLYNSFNWVVGTVIEAVDVMRWLNMYVNALDDTLTVKHTSNMEWMLDYEKWKCRCKKVDMDSPTEDAIPVALITANYDVCLAARRASIEYAYVTPAADYLRLLKDNGNRAMRYSTPKYNGMFLDMPLYDLDKSVSIYRLEVTPDSKSYSTLAYNDWYKHHPCHKNNTQGRINFTNDSYSLFYLKIKMSGFFSYQIPKNRREVTFDFTSTSEQRALPAFQPIIAEFAYRKYTGDPCLIYINLRSNTLAVRTVNLLNRKQLEFYSREGAVSGNADAVCLGFYENNSVEVASCLWSTVVQTVEPSCWILEVLDFVGYFRYTIGRKMYTGEEAYTMENKNWWVSIYSCYKMAAIKQNTYFMPFENCEVNIDFAIPCANKTVTGEITHFIVPPNGKQDGLIYEGALTTL